MWLLTSTVSAHRLLPQCPQTQTHASFDNTISFWNGLHCCGSFEKSQGAWGPQHPIVSQELTILAGQWICCHSPNSGEALDYPSPSGWTWKSAIGLSNLGSQWEAKSQLRLTRHRCHDRTNCPQSRVYTCPEVLGSSLFRDMKNCQAKLLYHN
jgi:hypothetical protein